MMNYHRRVAYILLTLVFLAAGAQWLPAATTGLHHVKVGYYNIPGFHNLSSSGDRSGYGYDFLQLVRRHSQLEFTYVGYDWSWAESMERLKNGQIDLLTGALRSPEREREFDYSFPIGTTCLNLYIRNRDQRYRPDEYSSYDGMRIGTVSSEMLDKRLYRMAERRHFHCKVVAYPDFKSMFRALDNREIDAICAIGTHQVTGYRILESFDNEHIYAIVKKGNKVLLEELNNAILEMDQSIGMWPLQLYQDNYQDTSLGDLDFSEKEMDFIRRHSTAATAIKIATDNDWRPYSWYENGKYHGIIVEFVDNLMKLTGMKYEFVQENISSEAVFRANPSVDLYTCFAGTKQYAEEQHLVVSPSFMEPSIAIISPKRFDQMQTMGLSKSTPMLNNVVRKTLHHKFIVYDSTEKLISAVKQGLVDGAVLYDYIAQIYIDQQEDKDLHINFLPNLHLPLHMVTRIEDDRELITIISKCINKLGASECNNIATRYLSVGETDMNVWRYMKERPWLPLLVLLISLSGFFLERYNKMKIVQKKDAQARQLAEAANDAKTSFLFNMSHDIRTPMNAIIGFRDLLEKHINDTDKRADYLKKIEDASMVLLSIINNVLEMARIEKGTVELDETAWSVEQFLDILYSIFGDMMEKKGLKFIREQRVEHPYIYCDPTKLREVLINILSNAYKYTPQGEVRMIVEELPNDKEGWVTYQTTISDTGLGMSEDFLPHLFEEFSREQNTTEAKIEGTGLGMPIVKRLVDLMNGTITVSSKKGEGTTFVITIPHRIADRASLVEHEGMVIDPNLFQDKRILLAEDNELNAEIAIEILSEKGFMVERAENGQMCCDMLQAAPDGYYDIILMDIQMPILNGYEATRQIRQMENTQKARIPILAMTANAFEEDKREAIRAGMNGHLTKPIDLHELTKMLASCIS